MGATVGTAGHASGQLVSLPRTYSLPMQGIRRHVTYANVAATLALVLATSGSAIAAKHYLLSSTRQISPALLKKLRGRTGKAGPQGAPGQPGANGQAGSPAPSALTSGHSESGVYSLLDDNANPAGGNVSVAVSFPIPLLEALPEGRYAYLQPGKTSAECSGPGHAAPGFLCVYGAYSYKVEFENIFDPGKEGTFGAGLFGFEIEFTTEGSAIDNHGSWTVTAR